MAISVHRWIHSLILFLLLLDELFERLNELMPEAKQIGLLRQQGITDEAIATAIGIKRTTFLSRLKKAREQLSSEYPELF